MDDDDIITIHIDGEERSVSVFDIINPSSPKISKDVRNARMSICKQCDRYSLGRCLECGCVMKLKTMLTNATCPLHKWGFENTEEV